VKSEEVLVGMDESRLHRAIQTPSSTYIDDGGSDDYVVVASDF
jgi:hypothetical protein